MKIKLLGLAAVVAVAGCGTDKCSIAKYDYSRPKDVPVAEAAAIDAMSGTDLTTPCEFITNGYRLRYRMHMPKQTEEKTLYPLVLFLHGAGERGDDNKAQLKHGVVPICKYAMKHGDAFVLAPQCPAEKKWVDQDWSVQSMRRPNVPTEELVAVMALLDEFCAKYPVDQSRIYVTGISMGGFGTWDIVARRRYLFAAMMPICGGVDETTAADYKAEHLGIRFFHGGADKTVSPDYSRRMDKALTNAGKVHGYTEYPGVDHDSWTRTYANEDNLFWMFAQHHGYIRNSWLNRRK